MNSSGTQTASRTKLFAAIIGGSAMVAMGTLTLAMHQEQTIGGSNGVYLSTGGGQMTLGGEVTTTTVVATAPTTEKAVPAVKATPFK